MITTLQLGRLGRFGNQCFTLAGCIGIAMRSGQHYGFPQWINHDHKDRFGSSEDVEIWKYLKNDLPPIDPSLSFHNYGYFWGYRDIVLPSGNWSVDAHLQSDKYFSHCMPLIRETFRLKDEPEQSDYVAIHYRAGDYQEGDDVHHPRCSQEYYVKAMSEFPEGTKFLIFSDDPERAFTLLQTQATKYSISVSEGNHYMTDFAKMKRCKSFITANSSYSVMAAILGEHPEKKIYCPERWFGKAWGAEYKTMAKDIYPAGSIIL